MTAGQSLLLQRLEPFKVRQTGANKYLSLSPARPDEQSPSLNIEFRGDGILLKDFGGPTEAVLEALDLAWPQILQPKAEAPKRKGRGPLVATYLYESIFGKLAFKSCRYQFPGSADKTFLLFRPDGKGGWIADLKDVERIPFGLPELMAAGPDETIFVLEGEKIVLLARDKLGIIATTSCGGHGQRNQWKLAAFSKAMKGRHVVILPDHDKPGEEYAATVAASIVGAAKSVKIVRLPLKNEGDDLEEWLDAGGTRDQLLALVEAAPLYGAEDAQPEEPESTTLSTVDPIRVEWLWRGRIAVGRMTVITGRPGVGKGLLLCYVAAHVSTGRPMHGDRLAQPAGDVLWIATEDTPAEDLTPRLIAAGGDRARVHAWNMDHPVSLPDDARRVIAELRRRNARLLIIDPAPTLLDKDHSSNNDANVRQSFAELSAACHDLGCALVLVRHTNKRTLGDAMDRGGGSIGWTGMARVELMLGRRPVEEGASVADAYESVVTLAIVKCNNGRWAPSLNLAIVEDGESARIEVVGETEATADDLCALSKPHIAPKTGEAEETIRQILGDGQWHRQREIMAATAAKKISEKTTKRAKKVLNVDTAQRSDGWWWRLPEGQGGVAMSLCPPGPVTNHVPMITNNNNRLDGQRVMGPPTHTPGPVTPGGHAADSTQTALPLVKPEGEDV